MAEYIYLRKDKGQTSVSELADAIYYTLSDECENICRDIKQDGKTALLCFEQYYFRVKSYVSLTVLLTEDGDSIEATVIGSGGGEGLMGFSWGANASIARKAEKALKEKGFY